MELTEPRTAVLGRYAELIRRIENARKQLVIDERERDRLRGKVEGIVSLNGPVAHDNTLFCLDPADRKLMAVPFRNAADIDHPDPLGVVEATRERLFRDSRPVIEREPDVDDLVEESAHVVEVGHRNGPRLIGRDL